MLSAMPTNQPHTNLESSKSGIRRVSGSQGKIGVSRSDYLLFKTGKTSLPQACICACIPFPPFSG